MTGTVNLSTLRLLSLLPPTYAIVLVTLLTSTSSPSPAWLIGVHVGAIGFQGALTILCIHRVRRDTSLSEAQRKKWTTAIFWFSLLFVPAYLLTRATDE